MHDSSASSRSSSPRALFIASIWPEATSSAAGVRTIAFLHALARGGYRVTVGSPGQNEEFRGPLEAVGFETITMRVNDSAVNAWLAEARPTVVFFDRFFTEEQFAARVREAAPHSIRVLDTVDLHFLRRERGGSTTTESDTLRELAAIHRSDLTLLTSPFEERVLASDYGIPPAKLASWGFSYPEEFASRSRPSYTDRRGVAFIGNFRHAPNADAVRYLARELWPMIRKRLPNLEIFVYGAYPAKSTLEDHRPKQGFHIVGPCDDAIGTLANHRALLAPLRYGAGIKGKISDAWCAGTPVITSTVGAEGMAGVHGDFAGVIADDGEAIVRALVAITGDDSESEREFAALARAGRAAVVEQYGELAQSARLGALLGEALASPEERRARDFYQRLLWREEARSTEYFSRWLESKEGARKP